LLMSVISARAATSRVREEVETAALRNESSGLWHLLDLVCDVVLPLDDQLRIMDKSARFSAMVMMQGKDVQGTCLQDFMSDEEDREAFERCATSRFSSLAEETVPRATHVKLRDTWGNQIRVELFCVQVQQLLGTRHFVGIREFSDTAQLPEVKHILARGRGRRRQQAMRAARGAPCSEGATPPASPDDGPGPPTEGSSDVSSSSEVLEQPPEGPQTLPPMCRALQETTPEAIQMVMARLIQMVHIQPPSGTGAVVRCKSGESSEGCCPLHARIAFIHRCVRKLSRRPCVRNLKEVDRLQCELCGLLSEPSAAARTQCFACHSDLRARHVLDL